MDFIQYGTENRVATITLNRPDKKNAFNSVMVSELHRTLKKAGQDNDVKVIIIKANGDAFCAGADLAYLKELSKFTYEENLADSMQLKEMFQQIYTLNKVVIAQVEGHAIAGGAGLATVCDLVFSVPEAKFGFTEVKIGFVPAIVSVFAIRKFGESHTKRLLFSGDLISTEDAKEIGLVNFISAKELIDKEVKKFANHLVTKTSANSLALTKNLIVEIQQLGLEQALVYAAELNTKARDSEDCKKGINAFLNKERIVW
ncbi:MAG: enoyl-CoA hydratase/isomerase family protein [Bacteroidetes bacterium]|nr:MAG: enoyl-CoA hydratase/isomerase family protein [Bacteroidota bacterium]RLD85736.1 MAG: enoyl-CoA hydratase/isomerase family protein [Bacteroidota bacterium]